MNLAQVFEYAIAQEIQAMEFYERSAAQTDNAEAAALFRSLARMEGAHRRVLEQEKQLLTETGEIERDANTKETAEESVVQSLRHVTKVLREANVDLQNKHKKMEIELQTGAQIQEALLPRSVPQLPELDISVSCTMAERVGGDYYDFAFTPGGQLALTIADVSGKGLPAALLMMTLRTLWRSHVQANEDPARVLRAISADDSMSFARHDQYVTMISATYDTSSQRLQFANAGHWPPLVYTEDGEESLAISAGFLPIGLEGDATYALHSLDLAPGNLVVFFTDGIIDVKNPEGEFFGEARFRDLVRKSRGAGAQEIRDTITTTIFEFSMGQQQDDQTLVVIKKT